MEPFADLEFEEDFYTAQVPNPTVISTVTTIINFRLNDISNNFTKLYLLTNFISILYWTLWQYTGILSADQGPIKVKNTGSVTYEIIDSGRFERVIST